MVFWNLQITVFIAWRVIIRILLLNMTWATFHFHFLTTWFSIRIRCNARSVACTCCQRSRLQTSQQFPGHSLALLSRLQLVNYIIVLIVPKLYWSLSWNFILSTTNCVSLRDPQSGFPIRKICFCDIYDRTRVSMTCHILIKSNMAMIRHFICFN